MMRYWAVLGLLLGCAADTTSPGASSTGGVGGSGGDGGAGAGGSPLEQGTCGQVHPTQGYYDTIQSECDGLGDGLVPYNCSGEVAAGCLESHSTSFVNVYCCPRCFFLLEDTCQLGFPYNDVVLECDFWKGQNDFGHPVICPSGPPASFGDCDVMNGAIDEIPACDPKTASEPLDVWCCQN